MSLLTKDYYGILGVPSEADECTIRRAYRKLAMSCHPDKQGGSSEANQRFRNINEAYEVLGNKESRASFDLQHCAFVVSSSYTNGPPTSSSLPSSAPGAPFPHGANPFAAFSPSSATPFNFAMPSNPDDLSMDDAKRMMDAWMQQLHFPGQSSRSTASASSAVPQHQRVRAQPNQQPAQTHQPAQPVPMSVPAQRKPANVAPAVPPPRQPHAAAAPPSPATTGASSYLSVHESDVLPFLPSAVKDTLRTVQNIGARAAVDINSATCVGTENDLIQSMMEDMDRQANQFNCSSQHVVHQDQNRHQHQHSHPHSTRSTEEALAIPSLHTTQSHVVGHSATDASLAYSSFSYEAKYPSVLVGTPVIATPTTSQPTTIPMSATTLQFAPSPSSQLRPTPHSHTSAASAADLFQTHHAHSVPASPPTSMPAMPDVSVSYQTVLPEANLSVRGWQLDASIHQPSPASVILSASTPTTDSAPPASDPMDMDSVFVQPEHSSESDEADDDDTCDAQLDISGTAHRRTKKRSRHPHPSSLPTPEAGISNPAINFICAVSLEEVFSGCVKRLAVSKRFVDSAGHQVEQRKILQLLIQPGAVAGAHLTLPGEGESAPNLPPSDVVVVLSERKHPRFKRHGDDLHYVHSLSLKEALIGAPFVVPTLDGRELFVRMTRADLRRSASFSAADQDDEQDDDRSPVVISPHSRKVIRGEGMPRSVDGAPAASVLDDEHGERLVAPTDRGDLIITFNIRFPQSLDPALLRAISSIDFPDF